MQNLMLIAVPFVIRVHLAVWLNFTIKYRWLTIESSVIPNSYSVQHKILNYYTYLTIRAYQFIQKWKFLGDMSSVV